MTTTTIYASEDGEVSAVAGGGVSFSSLRGDTGDAVDRTGTTTSIVLDAINYAGAFYGYELSRGIVIFDTSGIPDADTISAVTVSLRGTAEDSDLGAPTIGVTGGTVADTSTIAKGDYDGFASTEWASRKTTANWVTNNYNDFALNSSGIAAVSKTGKTTFYFRLKWDLDNNTSGLNDDISQQTAGFSWRSVDYTGTSSDPKIVIEHSSGYTPRPSGTIGSSNVMIY